MCIKQTDGLFKLIIWALSKHINNMRCLSRERKIHGPFLYVVMLTLYYYLFPSTNKISTSFGDSVVKYNIRDPGINLLP
jgi:hypothetical protein